MNLQEKLNAAQNPNTPVYLLEQLAKDKNYWGCCNVAENSKSPDYIKQHLYSRLF